MYHHIPSLIDPCASDRLEQPPKGLFAFYRHFLRQVWPLFTCVAITIGVLALINAALFLVVGLLIDGMQGAETPAAFFAEYGWLLALVAIATLVLEPLLLGVHLAIFNQSIVPAFTNLVRWQSHRHMLRQSMSYFSNDFAGRLSQKVMQTGLSLRRSVGQLIDAVWYVTVFWISGIGILAGFDVRLMPPLLVWLVAYGIALWVIVPRIKVRAAAASEAHSQLTGRIVDSYTNIQTVKLFGHTAREDDYARTGMENQREASFRVMAEVSNMELLITVMNGGLLLGHGALALWLWSLGEVSVGAAAASLALVMRVITMSHWVMFVASEIAENVGQVRDGADSIAVPHAVTDDPGAPPLSVTKGEIRFEQVAFNYDRQETAAGPVVHDLNLTIAPGEKVGLVGRSGAGKSTLVNLLLRFHDVSAGRILIDGQDISGVQQESLRSAIGMVTQDTSLLHRSVLDNIRYGRPEADLEQVEEAARRAHADEFIRDLEDPEGRRGYKAHVGERGVKLSGGQRQRIAIARVLLKNAPILILDEATSALDSTVEAAIQEQLFNLMAGKTVIAIAHRLSTIAAMDRLVILDRGRIVEQGSHTELLEQGGIYAELWARQSSGFIAEDLETAPANTG
ncbi:ABC transporter ATP-binding protein/permease [Nisaea acidiphila]|uniref:ABC transporter ATP-binding protein/permease n=1 Tax=Nisaea acidiphila TaxID=1862145 RepID=A0A9J7AW70_9PROT|nr:ABC transporter ATP-binding protein [Nisaea acidiphila]UUX51552.1 ABC transporter ATP-binding protein/permease [Nisaea acidiphila]